MAIVKTNVPMTYGLCEQTIADLVAAYPFLRTEVVAETALWAQSQGALEKKTAKF